MLICIKCNLKAHEICTKPLLIQKPCELHLAIGATDLDKRGRDCLKHLSSKKQMEATLCIKCENQIKAVKVHIPGNPPLGHPKKRMSRRVKVGSDIIIELHCLAAFQRQIFIFTEHEKVSKSQWEVLIREQFCCS